MIATKLFAASLILGLSLGAAAAAWAEDQSDPIVISLKGNRFTPAEIHVAAGKPALLLVRNEDSTPEEVESGPLSVEKVVPAGAQSKIRLRALEPGRYPFFGEYHPDTAQGVVIAE